MLDQMLDDLAAKATVTVAHEATSAVALAASPLRPRFRHRRGRGVSRAAKRRHARRIRALVARIGAHVSAARAWAAVASVADAARGGVREVSC